MNDIIIYGNSSVASISYYNLLDDSSCNVIAFTVDREVIDVENLYGLPVVPFDQVELRFAPHQYKMLIAVGYRDMNKLRAARYDEAKRKGYTLINDISSNARMCSDLSIGDNCMIGANTVIQPNVKIGNNVIIRENCIIGHNADIKDHCFIAGSVIVSGNVINRE